MFITAKRLLTLSILSLFTLSCIYAQTNNLSGTFLEFEVDHTVIKLPYYASQDLETADEEVERLVIVVHGTNRNADDYYANMRNALLQRPEIKEKTLIIAPQFLTEIEIDDHNLGRDYPY